MEQNKETPESILAENQALAEKLKAPVFELDAVCSWLLVNVRKANFIAGRITGDSFEWHGQLRENLENGGCSIEEVNTYCDIVSGYMSEIVKEAQKALRVSNEIFDIWKAASVGGNRHDK